MTNGKAVVAGANGNERTAKWVAFRLEQETYGIDVRWVREVLRPAEIVPVPGAPDQVLGIINLRGSVVTVIDARKRFRFGQVAADEHSRIIVLELDVGTLGLFVDEVEEVIALNEADREPPPSIGRQANSSYVEAVAKVGDRMLILIDPLRIIEEGDLEEVLEPA
ncbi:MAG: chemotaxis protein CheW [Pseudomonadota bacterium]